MASEHRKHDVLAWQGWQMKLPAKWSPVKLEGDWAEGHALFADLLRPRLGLRWSRPKVKKIGPEEWLKRLMRDEVGELAAKEARAIPMPHGRWLGSLLYIEPEPPGRDVWVGYSEISGRAVQLTYHAHRRERMLAESVLPSLLDLPADEPMPWSVFDLSCRLPPGWTLENHRLNAGDLSLAFSRERDRLVVRQIAVAELALKRMDLDQWLREQQRAVEKHYRRDGPISDVSLVTQNRTLEARSARLRRRRRFFYMRSLPALQTTLALHDKIRDRLILAQGSDEGVLKATVLSIGQET